MLILLSLAAHAAEPEVVATAPFALDQAYEDSYRADRPTVSAGTLVFLRVAEGSYQPRAVDSPVLYAGARPVAIAARTTTCLVAIVPSEVNLGTEPIFFGPTDLPERVDPKRAIEARDAAVKAGIQPQVRASARGATVLHLADQGKVYEQATARAPACR